MAIPGRYFALEIDGSDRLAPHGCCAVIDLAQLVHGDAAGEAHPQLPAAQPPIQTVVGVVVAFLDGLQGPCLHPGVPRRLQKWGVWEHLDEGKDPLQAIKESDDYTDYCLDRRLGCRQLGMSLTRRVTMHRLSEIYNGANTRFRGETIRTIYFEREYLPGIATDKLPLEKYARPGYGPKLGESPGPGGRFEHDCGPGIGIRQASGFR